MPNLGMVSMLDAETGEIQCSDTGSKSVQIVMKNTIKKNAVFQNSVKSGVVLVFCECRVNESCLKVISYFLNRDKDLKNQKSKVSLMMKNY
jgi:hypothetical protein